MNQLPGVYVYAHSPKSCPPIFYNYGSMKAFRLFLLGSFLMLGFTVGATSPVYAQGGLGVSAGANFDRLSDIDLSGTNGEFENQTGWHVELWYELGLGPVSVKPGIRYMDAGRLYEGMSEGDFRDTFSIQMVEVPLDLRFRFAGTPVASPYFSAGPVLRFPLASGGEIDDGLETVSVAGGVGVGVMLKAGSLRVYPEIIYTFGLSRFTKQEFELAGRTFTTEDNQLLNATMLRIGIGL